MLLLLMMVGVSSVWAEEATMAAGTNGSAAKVNDKDAIKVGTSKAGGDMTITVPAGATSLEFYAAAWNGVSGLSLNITPAANVNPTSVSLTADTGISGNSPFTLSGTESSYKFTIALSNISEKTTLTLTSSTTKRFVVWGATYTTGGGSSDPVLYTVTLGDNSATLTQTTEGGNVTLPSREGNSTYTFAGWSTENNTEETTTAPTIIAAGDYKPTASITLYPVYERVENGESTKLVYDFESSSSSENWTINSFTRTNGTAITAHGGSYWGSVNVKNAHLTCTTFITSNNVNVVVYCARTSSNTNSAGVFKLQKKTTSGSWTDLTSHNANDGAEDSWVKLSWDGSLNNEQIRLIYTASGTAVRAIDDFSITYSTSTTYYISSLPAAKTPTSLSWSATSATATIGESNSFPTLTTEPVDLTGVTYCSSNTGVATINSSTGEITLVAGGTTTITASYAGNQTYASASDSYTLTVSNNVVQVFAWYTGDNRSENLSFFLDDVPSLLPHLNALDANGIALTKEDYKINNTNPDVATVDENGNIVINQNNTKGQTTITASLTKSGYNTVDDAVIKIEAKHHDLSTFKWKKGDADAGNINLNVKDEVPSSLPTINNAQSLDVVYSIETANDWATIDAGTGVITFKYVEEGKFTKGGSATIKATGEKVGYSQQVATYTITVNKITTEASYDPTEQTYELTGNNFVQPSLSKTEGYDGTIIYSSDKPEIAEVATDGTITPHKQGTAIITATLPATDAYTEASATYTLIITDADAPVAFFEEHFGTLSSQGYVSTSGALSAESSMFINGKVAENYSSTGNVYKKDLLAKSSGYEGASGNSGVVNKNQAGNYVMDMLTIDNINIAGKTNMNLSFGINFYSGNPNDENTLTVYYQIDSNPEQIFSFTHPTNSGWKLISGVLNGTGSKLKIRYSLHTTKGCTTYLDDIVISGKTNPNYVVVPTFSIKFGSLTDVENKQFKEDVAVALASETEDASIFYTVDGTDPTGAAVDGVEFEYDAETGIAIDRTTTIKAIAVKGENKSEVASATYTLVVDAPTFTPGAGTYNEHASVILSAIDGSTIYYTTNGDIPTQSSSVYSEAISVDETTTVKAIAVKNGTPSSVASALYTIRTFEGSGAGTEEDPYDVTRALDFITKVYNTNSVKSDEVYVKGIVSAQGNQPKNFYISVDGKTNSNSLYIFGCTSDGTNNLTSALNVGDIVILKGNLFNYSNKTPELYPAQLISVVSKPTTPSIADATKTFYEDFTTTISCATDGASIFYTLNGSEPFGAASATEFAYTVGENIEINGGAAPVVLKAIAVKDKMTSDVATATYTFAVMNPTLSRAEGDFFENFSLTISQANGRAIYYTTNGEVPTSASTLYSAPISITDNTTIKAIAIHKGVSSDVVSATYTKKELTTISWVGGVNEASVNLIESEGEYTLPAIETNSTGAVTYEVDGDAIEVDGVVLFDAVGTYTITATVAADATHDQRSTTFTLSVTDEGRQSPAVHNFSIDVNTGFTEETENWTYGNKGGKLTVDQVTFDFSNTACYILTGAAYKLLNVNNGQIFTVSVPNGYELNTIIINGNATQNISANCGLLSYNSPNNKWTGKARSVVFSTSAISKITKIEASYRTVKKTPTLAFAAPEYWVSEGATIVTPQPVVETDGEVSYVVTEETEETAASLVDNKIQLTGTLGDVTITANAAASANYESASASYVLHVVEPRPLVVTSAGWATFAPSQNVQLPSEGMDRSVRVYYYAGGKVGDTSIAAVDAYETLYADGDDTFADYVEAEFKYSDMPAATIARGTGIIVKAEAGTYYFPVNTTVEPTELTGNQLVGVLSSTAKPGNNAFIFKNGSKGIGFYPWSTGDLAAGKCYLQLTPAQAAGEVRFIGLPEDDELSTSIELVFDENGTEDSYNLFGQKVDTRNYKGIIVKGGVKSVVK